MEAAGATPVMTRTRSEGDAPPVALFLPGLARGPWNSTARLAEIFCRDLTRGPGKYAVQAADAIDSSMTDGHRILDEHGTAVLDMYTVDYRDRLAAPAVAAGGLKGLAVRLTFQLWYFARVVALLFRARRRAKSFVAKVQMVIGFGAALALVSAMVITALSILAALGLYRGAPVPDTATDAVALGLTALTTWLLTRVEPTVRDAVVLTQKVLDYAENQRHAQGVTSCLADALDAILEHDPARRRGG
jgi:hypothetical protein